MGFIHLKMGFSETSLLVKTILVLLISGLILQIVGLALPYWYSVEGDDYKYYGGLFRYCVEAGNTDTCKNYSNLTSWFEATIAFEILGFLFILAAMTVTALSVFVMSSMKILKLIGWSLSFTACALILIGVCIYGGEADGTLTEYSGAFAVTIIAGIVCLSAGILGLLDWVGFKL